MFVVQISNIHKMFSNQLIIEIPKISGFRFGVHHIILYTFYIMIAWLISVYPIFFIQEFTPIILTEVD